MLKAKDIMTKQVISIRKNAPVLEAVELLWKNDITGIPVVEDDGTLVGILTEKDLIRLLYADEDLKNKTVSNFMTQPAVHFDENEALSAVCDCLMNYFLRRVPVTSKGKVVGIISRADIIEHILRQWRGDTVPAASASR